MKRTLSLLSLLLAVLSCLSAAHAQDELKIGAIYPLTGAAAFIGEGNRIGAEIAVEAINESGGIDGKKLKLIIEDSQSEPRFAVSAFQKLTERDRVTAVASQLTSVAMAVRPLAERARVLLLAESSHPNLVKGYNYVLRNFYSVDTGNALLYGYLRNHKLSRLAYLYAEEDFGVTALRDMERRTMPGDVAIVAREPFPKNATDLKPELLRIAKSKPDSLYIIGAGPSVALAFNQAAQLGIRAQFFGWIVCGQTNVFDAAKSNLEGALSVDADLNTEGELYKALVKRYSKRYPKRDMDHEVVIAYDAISIIADAMRKGARTGEEIRKHIVTTQKFVGAGGPIEFTRDGDSRRPLELRRIKNGICAAER